MPKRKLIIVGLLALVVVLYVVNGSKSTANGGTPAPAADQCRVSVNVDVLNVRSAPDSKAGIVGKYSRGAQTNADKKVTNGFRKVGDNRWVAAGFVQAVQGSSCS